MPFLLHGGLVGHADEETRCHCISCRKFVGCVSSRLERIADSSGYRTRVYLSGRKGRKGLVKGLARRVE